MRAERAIDRRIFVVGVPRSGTTLVQSLLAAHSELTSFTESHFFSRHFTHLPLLAMPRLTRNPVPRVREFLTENKEDSVDAADWLEENINARAMLPFQTRAVAENLIRVLDELTSRRGLLGWLEKTPRHLRYVPFIQSVEPHARFVHVIRDGVDVVVSLYQASQSWEQPYDLETCARRWNQDLNLSLQRATSPHDVFVTYEALTADPEKTMKALVTSLGLDWQPDILERYTEASGSLVTEAETWKERVRGAIAPSGASADALSESEREKIRHTLRQELYDELARLTDASPRIL